MAEILYEVNPLPTGGQLLDAVREADVLVVREPRLQPDGSVEARVMAPGNTSVRMLFLPAAGTSTITVVSAWGPASGGIAGVLQNGLPGTAPGRFTDRNGTVQFLTPITLGQGSDLRSLIVGAIAAHVQVLRISFRTYLKLAKQPTQDRSSCFCQRRPKPRPKPTLKRPKKRRYRLRLPYRPARDASGNFIMP
jgi:hypothetical protein